MSSKPFKPFFSGRREPFDMTLPASNYFTVQDKVDYFDCDNRRKMRISAAIRCMQRCSCEQMVRLGIPLEKLQAERMALILTKICIKVHRLPICNEALTVCTIPVGPVGVKYHREYFIDSAVGERLVSAFSYWILVDPISRKLHKPSKFPYDWDLRPSLIGDIVGDIPLPRRSVPETIRATVPVRYSDIDWNNHVNNTIYPDFICDALLDEIRDDRKIDLFTIAFKNESILGDRIEVFADPLDGGEFYLVGRHERGTCFESLVRFSS